MEEVQRHLRLTSQPLPPDCFTFTGSVSVVELQTEDSAMVAEDVSGGAEALAVPVVNTVDSARPELLHYCTSRIPQGGVLINSEPGFLACCSCRDNCAVWETCSCRRMTSQATLGDDNSKVAEGVGYQWRRLYQQVVTGIYECHPGCSCSSLCHNRVVQEPTCSPALQVFRTRYKGWGLRTVADLPRGTFISTYVGNLYTPEEGNAMGTAFGDEYFAALDLIEEMEKRKEGYESDVSELSCYSSSSQSSSSSPDDSDSCWRTGQGQEVKRSHRLQDHSRAPQASSDRPVHITGRRQEEPVSVRELLGDVKEEPYILDARVNGNVGKYINHSCDPNLFAQNVFVDSHDLRFPWLAFFTSREVAAGEEVTFDYNYVVDSVPGKRIDCHCGAEDCRKRLL